MKINKKNRSIIIGDVHGCIDELNALITKVNYRSENDSLYFLGDIINRGPYSKDAFFRVLELGGISTIGNHEWHILEAIRRNEKTSLVSKMEQEFGDQFQVFVDQIKTWPVFIETDDFILVHAGLVPDKKPQEKDARILTSIRTWDYAGNNLNDMNNPPWFDLYKGSKLVIFAHWAALGGIIRENAIGLDSGCVYGKQLSALILPDRKVVKVPAAMVYHSIDDLS